MTAIWYQLDVWLISDSKTTAIWYQFDVVFISDSKTFAIWYFCRSIYSDTKPTAKWYHRCINSEWYRVAVVFILISNWLQNDIIYKNERPT